MKKYNYFDDGKSLVENSYYLLMILSIVFVVIQVVIARDSLDHNANLELTQHTVEQDNHYRETIEAKAEEFINAMISIRMMESEMAGLEKRLANRLKHSPVRNT